MNVDLFQWCANVHFPSQPHAQAPAPQLQAHPAFLTAVLFRVAPSSAAEVHWRYEPAQCAMATGRADVPAPP